MNSTERLIVDTERGSAILNAMVTLLVLTIIGVGAIRTTTSETRISGAAKRKAVAFYTAEAGIEHAKLLVSGKFNEDTGVLQWDLSESADSYANGEVLVNAQQLGKYQYKVTAWHADNQAIHVRSEAWSDATGGRSAIEILFRGGKPVSEVITDYVAQAGAGSGKSFNSHDTDVITSFTQQVTN